MKPRKPAIITEFPASENRVRSLIWRKWIEEGLCPKCGEKGPFVAGGPVCSTHGPYEFQVIRSDTPSMEDWLGEEDGK